MAVNRCICKSVPFESALMVAKTNGCTTVVQLQNYLPLGTGCGLCVPYMQRSLITGETDLPVLGETEAASLLELSGFAPEEEGHS